MKKLLIYNPTIINENNVFKASLIIENNRIKKILKNVDITNFDDNEIYDATGLYLIPGIIDTHVHFREPGLISKADIFNESRAAAAGGVTTFFDMPNTKPQTISNNELQKKFNIAQKKSLINYSFHFGATNDNINEIENLNISEVPAVKLFYASSTGNMLVNNTQIVERIFKKSKIPIVVHSEENQIINNNLNKILSKKDKLTAADHEFIRSQEACFKATDRLIKLAKKYDSKIHFLHITTKQETELFSVNNVDNKKITAEVTPNHLFFDSSDYEKMLSLIKCNPSIKSKNHKLALLDGLKNNKIDTIATDHAPHILSDKKKNYEQAPAGIPSIQHSFNIVLGLKNKGILTLNQIVEKMCHNPARIFKIKDRGFIKPGFFADLTIFDLKNNTKVLKKDLLYKCKWSPLEGKILSGKVKATFVNGNKIYDNGKIIEYSAGQKIEFQR